jgi:menaquinone-dependent protoporphyrinogen IX oxidase
MSTFPQWGSADNFYIKVCDFTLVRRIKMRKVFKIILAVFAALIIIVAAFGAIIFLDIAAYTATGSQTLTPKGTPTGKALVVYDPGLSGLAKRVADKVASDLQTDGYTVTLAGIKSSVVSNTTDYGTVIVGGPIYAGSPTASVKDYLNNLPTGHASPPSDVAMIRNSVAALSANGTLSSAIVVKIGQTEDLNSRAQDFVDQVIQ